MKCYTIDGKTIQSGIRGENLPFPRIVLGDRNARHFYVPVDEKVVRDWKITAALNDKIFAKVGRIYDVDIVSIKNSGRYKIISPSQKSDNILVHWKLTSGYGGKSRIDPMSVGWIAMGEKNLYQKGKGKVAEIKEILVVIEPGESMFGQISEKGLVSKTIVGVGYDKKLFASNLC